MAYPINDDKFEDKIITAVTAQGGGGWAITNDDGWSFWVQGDSPVTPAIGMPCRMYGDGIDRPVRGLFLDGQKVYYRSEAEEVEHHEVSLYGKDAADWLARWDAGGSVWSIEMGGMGPGYEQCIQILAAEVLRHLLAEGYDHSLWQDGAVWSKVRDALDSATADAVLKLGPSGAQFGAAKGLATMIYMHGPRGVMADKRVADRHIQVSKNFPSLTA